VTGALIRPSAQSSAARPRRSRTPAPLPTPSPLRTPAPFPRPGQPRKAVLTRPPTPIRRLARMCPFGRRLFQRSATNGTVPPAGPLAPVPPSLMPPSPVPPCVARSSTLRVQKADAGKRNNSSVTEFMADEHTAETILNCRSVEGQSADGRAVGGRAVGGRRAPGVVRLADVLRRSRAPL
jgi:hypothetical protein